MIIQRQRSCAGWSFVCSYNKVGYLCIGRPMSFTVIIYIINTTVLKIIIIISFIIIIIIIIIINILLLFVVTSLLPFLLLPCFYIKINALHISVSLFLIFFRPTLSLKFWLLDIRTINILYAVLWKLSISRKKNEFLVRYKSIKRAKQLSNIYTNNNERKIFFQCRYIYIYIYLIIFIIIIVYCTEKLPKRMWV